MNTDINFIADEHYEWLKEMGYTKASPLEALALICSEVGEAINECRGKEPTEKLGAEIADIILRSLGFARQRNIDIVTEITKKMAVNQKNGNKGRII